MINKKVIGAFIFIALLPAIKITAQTDTLRVLSYNVLYLGDTPPCQGPHSTYEGYLSTITGYLNPDIIGLVKMAAIPMYAGDNSGSAPAGFADSLLRYSFNAAFPGRYAYCTYTNTSGANNMGLLFYNQQKLGFDGILSSYANITDFNTYKLYYKSPNLATTHDTIFLYVTLNHTNSGSGSSDAAERQTQIAGELAQIETHFSSLPNMINMGDFNTHNSSEACYQALVAPANLNYRYYDPPFFPDATYAYPADWDDHPGSYSSCLSVSTRETSGTPNSCSSDDGGGKSWYDHIFLSAKIINNADHISYIPHSFSVVGNDGNRLGISVNSSPANTSAPAGVINAIFEMSEHYPIALSLLVDTAYNAAATATIQAEEENVIVVNPVATQLDMRFTKALTGKTMDITCIDELGRQVMKTSIEPAGTTMQLPCTWATGIYYLKFETQGRLISAMTIQKK